MLEILKFIEINGNKLSDQKDYSQEKWKQKIPDTIDLQSKEF